MSTVAQIFLTCVALLTAYSLGHITGRFRRRSVISVADRWPVAHVQFDPEMSREDMLRFIKSVESSIQAGQLTKAQGLKDSGTCDKRN